MREAQGITEPTTPTSRSRYQCGSDKGYQQNYQTTGHQVDFPDAFMLVSDERSGKQAAEFM